MKVMGIRRLARTGRYYAPEFKKEVLEVLAKENLLVSEVSRLYGISEHTIYGWREKHRQLGDAGLVNKRPGKVVVHTVPDPIRQAIVEAKKEHPESGPRRIRDFLSRFHFLGVSKGVVEKTLKEEGLFKPLKRRKKHVEKKVKRFERAFPNEMWQSDIMTFWLKRHYQVYLIGFMDDCSRFLVGWGLYRQQLSDNVCEVLLGALGEHGLPKEMLTDNGRQYAAWRGQTKFQELLEKRGIRHIRSRPYHPQTCGKIEAFWGHLWKEFLQKAIFESFDEARERIGHWVKYYNFQRPHQALDGMTPSDRFFGVEGKVKETMKAGLKENEKLLAQENAPTKPFFLTGRFGDKDLTIRQEGSDLVVDLPGGQTERIRMASKEDGRPYRTQQEMEQATEGPKPVVQSALSEGLTNKEVDHGGRDGSSMREAGGHADSASVGGPVGRREDGVDSGGPIREKEGGGALPRDGGEPQAVLQAGETGAAGATGGAQPSEARSQEPDRRSGEGSPQEAGEKPAAEAGENGNASRGRAEDRAGPSLGAKSSG